MKSLLKSAAIAVLAVAIATSPVYAAEIGTKSISTVQLDSAFASQTNTAQIASMSSEQMSDTKGGELFTLVAMGLFYAGVGAVALYFLATAPSSNSYSNHHGDNGVTGGGSGPTCYSCRPANQYR